MKTLSKLFFTAYLCCGSVIEIRAQEQPSSPLDFEQSIQQFFPGQNHDLPYEELYETFLQYYQSPLDLNKVTRDELASLYLLTEFQINNFIQYRHEQGPIVSIYELQVIPGFDLPTIEQLIHFVKVGEKTNYKQLTKSLLAPGNKYLLFKYERNMERKRGYKDESSGYQGSADKIYGKLRLNQSNKYSLGFTFEKDAGESLQWNPPAKKYGFDYWSYHLLLKNMGNFKSLMVGDYLLQFGQGLVFGAGFSPGKGGETVSTLRKYNVGIRPYSSAVETGFFRGVATTYAHGKLEFTGFYSNHLEDGAMKKDSLNEDYVRSIQISGFHRTPSELDSRKRLRHQSYGANLAYNFSENLNLGFTLVNTQYNISVKKKPTRYNQFDFTGTSNYACSFYYSWIFQNFNLFGEAAHSRGKGQAIVSGMLASLSQKVDMSIVYRNYTRDFHSFYGNAFGENTRNSNEEGIYIGFKIAPVRHLIFTSFFDRFFKPWLSFQAYAPSHGYEYLGKLAWSPSKNIQIYLQYRFNNREANDRQNEGTLPVIKEEHRANYLINIDFKPINNLAIKSRLQSSTLKQGTFTSSGISLYTDAVYEKGRFKISGRCTIFDTDDYASRIYSYENDLLYTYSIPGLYGQGIRNYLMIEYRLNRNIDIWVKAARTNYNNVESIGTGMEKIEGSKKTDIKFQIRHKF